MKKKTGVPLLPGQRAVIMAEHAWIKLIDHLDSQGGLPEDLRIIRNILVVEAGLTDRYFPPEDEDDAFLE